MSQIVLICPHCNMRLGAEVAPQPGSVLTCPTCQKNFAAPALPVAPAPLAAPQLTPQAYSAPLGYDSYSAAPGPSYYPKPTAKPAASPAAGDSRKLYAGLAIAAAIVLVGGGVLAVALAIGVAIAFSGKSGQVATKPASADQVANAAPGTNVAPAGSGAETVGTVPPGANATSGKSPSAPQTPGGGVSIASLPLSQSNPSLSYNWQSDQTYAYTYSLTADNGPGAARYHGSLSYKLNAANGDRASRLLQQEGAQGAREGTGQRLVVHQDGLLVTCAHVVRGASKMNVALGGKEYAGDVVGIDDRHDLALIRIAATNLPAVPLADSEKVQLAESVRAVGFPLSTVLGDSVKITTGSVSGFVTKMGDKLLQVDASINPGNSGGPLINDRGEVVGVNSAVMVGEAVSDVGFAVPSNYVWQLLRDKGVVPTAVSAGRVLDGPSLARATVPSVAFVKVDLGGGSKSLQALDFHGYCRKDASSQISPAYYSGLDSSQDESGQMLVSKSGELLEYPSKIDLPFLMMPLAQAAIEKLPSGGEREWGSRRLRALSLVATTRSPDGRDGLGSYGRIDPRRSRYFGSTPQETRTVVVIPAVEQVKYKVTAESEETIDIDKSIDLSTVDRNSQGGQLQVAGTGKLVWDKKLGVLRSLKQSMTMVVSSANVKVTAPLEFEVTFQSAKTNAELAQDLERYKAQAKAAAEAKAKENEAKLSSAIETLKSGISSPERLRQPLADLQHMKVDPERRDEVSKLLEPILAARPETFSGPVDKNIPETALKVAKVWGTSKNVKSILKHLDSTSRGERGAAIDALGELEATAEVAEAVAKRLKDSSDRHEAGQALKKMGPLAEDPVYKCLSDKDPEVKHAALRVLGDVGTEKSLAKLKKVPEIKDTLLKMYLEGAVTSIEIRLRLPISRFNRGKNGDKTSDTPEPFGDVAVTPKTTAPKAADVADSARPKVAEASAVKATDSKDEGLGDSARPKAVEGSAVTRPKVVKLRSKEGGDKPGEVRRFSHLSWGIKSVAFSPDGAMLAVGKPDRSFLLLDVNEQRQLYSAEKLEILQSVELCRFTPDGRKLITGGRTGILLIWDVSPDGSLKESGQFAGHSNEVNTLAFSADGKLALSGGEEKRVRLWNVETGRELGAVGGFEGKVRACILSQDGKAAYATDGAMMFAINLEKQEVVKRSKLTNYGFSGQFACYSPDYKYLATGDSHNVRVWEIQTGKELRPLEGQEIQWSGAFTPDGTRLVTGASGKVNVWDFKKARRIAALATGGSYVQCLATSPDNDHVSALGDDQDLLVLRLPRVDD